MKLPAWVPWIALPLLGAAGSMAFTPGADPIIYHEVIVPAARILEQEPTIEVRWRERVTTVIVKPWIIGTAPQGAMDDLTAFCRPSIMAATNGASMPSSVTEAATDILSVGRSVVIKAGWFWQRDKLTATSMNNYGDLRAEHFNVRNGFSVRFGPNPSVVRSPRFGLVKDILEVIIPAAAGYGACKVIR